MTNSASRQTKAISERTTGGMPRVGRRSRAAASGRVSGLISGTAAVGVGSGENASFILRPSSFVLVFEVGQGDGAARDAVEVLGQGSQGGAARQHALHRFLQAA